jgi:Molecular chaperone (small heat shock protein)
MANNLLSLIDQFFDDNVRAMTYSFGRPFAFAALPALNVKEYADRYEVSLAAPGIDPQKVKIELKENILTISYENKENKKEQSHQEGDLIRQEYSEYINFTRSLSLPKNVDSESIKAKYTRGILHIHITKLPEAQPKTISVEVEE